MIRYLIQRPVAVLLSFLLMLGLGFYFFKKIPVSLLPTIDVPRIVISASYPDHTASEIEAAVLKPLREALLTTDGLIDISSKAASHNGTISIIFGHGTRMDLAYVEVNEKIDRVTALLPRHLPRPLVTRINTSDIPVLRLHILPPKDEPDQTIFSDLVEKVIKKRVEQIPGVSVVDINGRSENYILVTPNPQNMIAYGLDASDIAQAIKSANQDLGSLSVRDGQYRYFIKVATSITNLESVRNIPVRTQQDYIPLHRICTIGYDQKTKLGYHIYNGETGLVLTVQKQAQARMNELMPALYEAISHFKTDYPTLRFESSRDQKFLLDAGIDNLRQDIYYGGILTIALLFLFLGHWSAPTLMSISIPLSLVISVIFFYWLDVSFNIISLSGVALGIGMLIDNSIVVLDHISRKRKNGNSLTESAIQGTNEMVVPVVSQVLTTVAVYAPLVLLHGIAGDLVKDQAKALTISLGVSLIVAFVLAPMLYKILLTWLSKGQIKDDTIFYKWVERGYHRMIDHILRHKPIYFMITLIMMPLGFWIATKLPVRTLPKIEKTESLLRLDWNESIDAAENYSRCQALLAQIKPYLVQYEADIGIKQFILQDAPQAIQEAEVYYACRSEAGKDSADRKVTSWLAQQYPATNWQILDAPNAFTQLFSTDQPMLEARFAQINDESESEVLKLYQSLEMSGALPGEALTRETMMEIIPDYQKMALYGISRQNLDMVLEQLFGTYHLTDIHRSGDLMQINLKAPAVQPAEKLKYEIKSNAGARYPLSLFVTFRYNQQAKYLTADRSGLYYSMRWDQLSKSSIKNVQKNIATFSNSHGIPVHFSGQYFEDQKQLKQLVFIFILVILLMYFILAIQYESLVQPLLVMLTIPLGITGAMAVLWWTGGSLDTMAAIGFIVILGLIVDDPILKIETLNRLNKKYLSEGQILNDELMKKMIHEAGSICLKPLLMVSLTTSLALVPVLFIPGLGNDLQKPMVWVIIGGLTIGTFFTTWFVPLAYWYWRKGSARLKNKV